MSAEKVILDTNIVSYLMKGRPEAKLYVPHFQGRLLSISFITVGELYYGAEHRKWGEKKRKELETTLRNFVVIPYDHDIARCYGKITAEQNLMGNPISLHDAWIAACAVRHGIPLLTHNAKDFLDITGLDVITEYVQKNDQADR